MMGRRVEVLACDNRIRHKRQAVDLSQGDLAKRCGLTRQAISAIEAGHYIPNTTVALRIARALGCTVEEVFRLPEELPRVEAEWLGAPPAVSSGRVRVRVARVGERLFARPLTGIMAAFTPADGVTVAVTAGPSTPRRPAKRVAVELLADARLLDHTVVVFGCDPALAVLGAAISRRYPALRLVWEPQSSLTALRMLTRGEAHAAGVHLWDQESGECNLPSVQRERAGRHLLLVTLSEWQQGLIVARGNPKGISGPADLPRPDVTLVNRDPGSGSRTLLDAWLCAAGILPSQVRGYAREVPTQLAVGEAVGSGTVDVGPGILAVARMLGLDFVPLQRERYDLVIPLEFLNTPAVQALLEVAVSPPFRGELEALGGYDTSQTGTVVAELAS
jgi:putative molybdopterin biosynthesis protein